jgi:hypothetical protein
VGACDLRDGKCYTDYKQSLLEAQKMKAQLNYTAYSSAVCTYVIYLNMKIIDCGIFEGRQTYPKRNC